MEKCDILIAGAGVVGLAIAEYLSRQNKNSSIIVIEKHESFGRETSSRNSEVIHAGIYYPTESLKAGLCVEGRELLYNELENHGLPFAKLGKLIVATDRQEEELLEKLLLNAKANGVRDVRMMDKAQVAALEPELASVGALYSPSTGIFDTHVFMKHLEYTAQNRGVLFAYNCEVVSLSRSQTGYEVGVRDVDGSDLTIDSAVVINCAGLCAHLLAQKAGINCKEAGYVIHYSKGEYFRVNGLPSWCVKHLVYPPPGTVSLGIHTVLDLQGQMKLGPNAFYVDGVDYTVDARHQHEFLTAGTKYLPRLADAALTPDMAGVRPKLQAPESDFADFEINEESGRGFPGFINLVGIESPGLTSSMAIARYAAELI
jgi:L-2-hydroxyglutarate oxidase LhgO